MLYIITVIKEVVYDPSTVYKNIAFEKIY